MKRVEYKIRALRFVCDGVIDLDLVPRDAAKALEFRPGQYGQISFLRGHVLSQERPFSFSSSPTQQASKLGFGFKIFGRFTDELSRLKVGDSVFVRGPYGSFTFDERKYPDAVFLAGGIGITPFMSIFYYAADKHLANKLTLIFSNKTLEQTPFLAELENLQTLNPNFKAVLALTKTLEPPAPFVTGQIDQALIQQSIGGDFRVKTFFICGPQPFSEAMIRILKSSGAKTKNIKIEGFSLAPSSFFEAGTWAFPGVVGASALAMFVTLYSVYQFEVAKTALKNANTQVDFSAKMTQLQVLNQKITDFENNLLVVQKANTVTEQTVVPQVIEKTVQVPGTQPSTPTSTSPKTTTTTKPTMTSTTTTTPKPTTTPVVTPTPTPVVTPTPPSTKVS